MDFNGVLGTLIVTEQPLVPPSPCVIPTRALSCLHAAAKSYKHATSLLESTPLLLTQTPVGCANVVRQHLRPTCP